MGYEFVATTTNEDGDYEEIAVGLDVENCDLRISLNADTINVSDTAAHAIARTFNLLFTDAEDLLDFVEAKYPVTYEKLLENVSLKLNQ